MKKKWLVILMVCILVGVGGFWALNHFKPVPQMASVITTTVMKGDVKQEITATGTLSYPEEVPLAFEQTGTVKEIYVEEGDSVTAGQVLAQLDTETLEQELTESLAALKEAELSWQQQKVEAEAALIRAKQTLRQAEQKADAAYLDNQVYIAEQNVKIASNDLASAQQKGEEIEILKAQSALTQVQADLLDVQAAKNGDAAQEVDMAKADLAIAETKLERLVEKTLLAEAETKVVKAQENLAKATLQASADGVIIDMAIKEGQTVSDSSTAMTLATGGDLLLVEAAVSQTEVTQIKVGQKVEITLDSNLEEVMEASVTKVATKGATTQSVTTFAVTMQMNKPYEALLAGMNVNVSIIVAEAKDVLVVPSLAIQNQGGQKGVLLAGESGGGTQDAAQEDVGKKPVNKAADQDMKGANGQSSVPSTSQRPENSGVRFVPVEVGLDDGTYAEIKSGLTEGQAIVAGNRSSSMSTINSPNGGGMPIGGTMTRGSSMPRGGVVIGPGR